MRIDPFYLMVMGEFLLIFLALTVYLFFRLKRASRAQRELIVKAENPDLSILTNTFKKEMEELEARIEKIPEKDDNLFHINLQRKIFELNLDFIKTIHDSIVESEGLKALSESLTIGFRKAANRSLLWVKDIIEGKNQEIQLKSRESAEKDEIIERLGEKIHKQKQRLAELMGMQDMVEQLKKRVEFLKERNRELKSKLEEAKNSDDKDAAYQAIVEELEANNKDLLMCVQTLEKENERLMQKLREYEEGFNAINSDVNSIVSASNGGADQAEINRLKEELQAKDKEIENLKTELENLEREYTALYKQVHEAEQQEVSQ
ncbi:MAG: hypothetical protein D6710_09465 [Nitrospirae bacterium]|nr:MAG: hypothetical protein D6710_09465 [Nitrospirota bacterium]